MRTITTRIGTLIAGTFLPFFLGCSSMEVQTNVDPQTNLSQYKTYAWAPQPPPSPARPQASALDQTVRSSVEKELAAKGLQPAQGTQPDLLISYFGKSKSSVTYGAPMNPGGAWAPHDYGGHYNRPIVTRQGSLTLQFRDAGSDRIVWEGTATDAIGETGVSQDQVAKAVNELLKKYPAA